MGLGEVAGTSAVAGDGDQVDTGVVAGDQEADGNSGTAAVVFLSAAAAAGDDSCFDILCPATLNVSRFLFKSNTTWAENWKFPAENPFLIV